MQSKILGQLAAGGFDMRTGLRTALLLFGILLLVACSGDGDSDSSGSVEQSTATNCTLGASALGSCALK